MFDKEVWSLKKCPDCNLTAYDFTWDDAQLYRICGCGFKTLLGQKVKILMAHQHDKQFKKHSNSFSEKSESEKHE
jgi:hypothetical protein